MLLGWRPPPSISIHPRAQISPLCPIKMRLYPRTLVISAQLIGGKAIGIALDFLLYTSVKDAVNWEKIRGAKGGVDQRL